MTSKPPLRIMTFDAASTNNFKKLNLTPNEKKSEDIEKLLVKPQVKPKE